MPPQMAPAFQKQQQRYPPRGGRPEEQRDPCTNGSSGAKGGSRARASAPLRPRQPAGKAMPRCHGRLQDGAMKKKLA
jgi:hypothetical protein